MEEPVIDPAAAPDVAAVPDASAASAVAADSAASAPLSGVGRLEAVGDMVEAVVGVDRLIRSLTAVKYQMAVQAKQAAMEIAPESMDTQLAERSFRAELALALTVPERTVENLLGEGQLLVEKLPATLAALAAGEITSRHAKLMVDHTAGLDAADRAWVEKTGLLVAPVLTAAKFDRRLRVIRERRTPEAATERHQTAAAAREVRVEPGRDGMGWLTAYLPAPELVAIDARLDDAARAVRRAGDDRTLTQLRADLFSTALLGEPDATYATIRPTVLVTVPALTLLDHTDEPAMLEGYGPIDPDTAKELTAQAPHLRRLLTHPDTGAVLSLGRTRYQIPADLRLWLRIRDGGCRFPGCGTRTRHTDIDHTLDWARGGRTDHQNLANLHEGHHTIKHTPGWQATQTGDGTGVLDWTSPLGRHYRTHPEFRAQPAPPHLRVGPGSPGSISTPSGAGSTGSASRPGEENRPGDARKRRPTFKPTPPDPP